MKILLKSLKLWSVIMLFSFSIFFTGLPCNTIEVSASLDPIKINVSNSAGGNNELYSHSFSLEGIDDVYTRDITYGLEYNMLNVYASADAIYYSYQVKHQILWIIWYTTHWEYAFPGRFTYKLYSRAYNSGAGHPQCVSSVTADLGTQSQTLVDNLKVKASIGAEFKKVFSAKVEASADIKPEWRTFSPDYSSTASLDTTFKMIAKGEYSNLNPTLMQVWLRDAIKLRTKNNEFRNMYWDNAWDVLVWYEVFWLGAHGTYTYSAWMDLGRPGYLDYNGADAEIMRTYIYDTAIYT